MKRRDRIYFLGFDLLGLILIGSSIVSLTGMWYLARWIGAFIW